MEPSNPEGESTAQDDAARRAEALRELAHGQVAERAVKDASASTSLAPLYVARVSGSSRLRFWLGVALMVTLLVVVVASIFSHMSIAPMVHQPRTPAVAIAPATELITCPTNLSWSPDARMIAVVGYSNGCLSVDSMNRSMPDVASAVYEGYSVLLGVSGRVAIYDAHNGGRLDVFSPDDAIYQALRDGSLITSAYADWLGTAGITPDHYLGVKYTNLVWSADQNHLYLTFTSYIPDGPPVMQNGQRTLTGRVVQGLFISGLNGQHGQVLLHVSDPQSAGAVVWDLTTKRMVTVLPASLPFALQPVTPAYAWQNGQAPEPASTPAAVKGIGVPLAGSAAFTVWQPGVVATQLNTNQPVGPAELYGVATFATNFAALSPDGRYLAASLGVAAVLSTGAPNAQTLAQAGWQVAPHLPTRDAGLQRTLAMAARNGGSPSSGEQLNAIASVAWRPDGRLIAVSAGASDRKLILLDCATGKQVAALSPAEPTANNTQGDGSLIMWAPNGHSLAYFDPTIGSITLWDSSWLPA